MFITYRTSSIYVNSTLYMWIIDMYGKFGTCIFGVASEDKELCNKRELLACLPLKWLPINRSITKTNQNTRLPKVGNELSKANIISFRHG